MIYDKNIQQTVLCEPFSNNYALLDYLQLTTNDALHSAVAENKLKLLKILLEGGLEVNRLAYDGKTALTIVCCNFGVDLSDEYIIGVIKLLLKHKADPNVQDLKGRTAIMYAVRNIKPKTAVDLLLQHGADPLICDNFGQNAISFIQREYWFQYSDSFRQYVDPTVVSLKNTHNDKIKDFKLSHQTKEKHVHGLGYQNTIYRLKPCTKFDAIEDKTVGNNMQWRFSENAFCPHSAPSVTEDAVPGEQVSVRRISHIPSYMNADISGDSMIEEAEFGHARQERVNSDPTTQRQVIYERDRLYSLKGKQRCRKPLSPLRRHSNQEASTMSKDDRGRTLRLGKNGCTSNSDTDMSLMDNKILKHGAVRRFPKLPPIEKIPNETIKYGEKDWTIINSP